MPFNQRFSFSGALVGLSPCLRAMITHINPTSAAIGVGLDGLSSVDIDGEAQPWPAGTHPDLGADEISAGKFFIFLPTVMR